MLPVPKLGHRWRELAAAELARRQPAGRDSAAAAEAAARLIRELDEMAARMIAAPDWRPMTVEEAAENEREIDQWFRERRCRV